MNDFWKNLAALIKVKTIVTMVVIGVFCCHGADRQVSARHGDDCGDHGCRLLFRYADGKVTPDKIIFRPLERMILCKVFSAGLAEKAPCATQF